MYNEVNVNRCLPAVFGTTSALSCRREIKCLEGQTENKVSPLDPVPQHAGLHAQDVGERHCVFPSTVSCVVGTVAPLTSKVTLPRGSLSAAMSKKTVGLLLAAAGPLLHIRAAVTASEHSLILFDTSNIFFFV